MFCSSLHLFANDQIGLKKVFFENHTSVSDKKLDSFVSVFIGIPIDKGNAEAIANAVETKLRITSKLSFAVLSSYDRKNGVITIKVGQYRDIDDKIVREMKYHVIEDGKINRIFFSGNRNITTKELCITVRDLIGSSNTYDNQQKILDKIEKLYKNRGHKDIFGRFIGIDSSNGIFYVRIEKKK